MTHRFSPVILREYDVRGTVGSDLSVADAYALGRSFATYIRQTGGRRIAVGRDGRLTSAALEAALVEGLTASGIDVVRIGLGPTPMLYYAEAHLEVDGGIQVTGSHNPRDDNGFKLTARHRSFFGEDIQRLAALAAAGDWAEGSGSVAEADVRDAYVGRLMAGYAGGDFRIGWDCGNGAAGPIVEQLTQLLPGEHHLLHTDVDGEFPNHHPDPTIEANLADLKQLVAARKLDFGVAFDGDGDRIGAVDGAGRVVWADQILSILAEPVLRATPGATIIADVKASRALFERVSALGGKPVMWKSGHSLMKEKLRETGAPLAGEMSGHIFFGADFYGVDDALFAAVQLIRALHMAGRSLGEMRDAMPAYASTPELRFPVAPERRTAVVGEVIERLRAAGRDIDLTDGARVTSTDGWWLLRASNTQSMLTVRAEGSDEVALQRLLSEVDAELAASGVTRD